MVVIELTGQPPALEAVGEIPAAFIGLVLDEGGSAGTVALEGAVSPFPAQCARSVSLARGKVAAVVVSLPDFDDESVFERVLAMVERALVEKLGKPKRAKKQLSYEEWRSYTWGSEGREITVRGSAYLEPSGQVTHRRIEVSNRAL